MNNHPVKTGLTLNQVTGNHDWFLVEFDDGTAAVYSMWEEAMTAGNFDTNE